MKPSTILIIAITTNIPLLFEKIHIDPAIATGPFVQITNDLLGIAIYIGVISLMV